MAEEAGSTGSRNATAQDALLRSMPWVFVLIWSTGFVVARYGMPYAPPMKFLALRFALSVLGSWSGVGWRARDGQARERSGRIWPLSGS